jgi:uncharacterized protein (TIGR03790 family)
MHRNPMTSFVVLLAISSLGAAVEPAEVFLLVNKSVPESSEVALHYCAKRSVPRDNVIELELPSGEDISRKEFDTKLLLPLRAALKDRREKVKVLVSTFGVPLRVGRPELTATARDELSRIEPELAVLQAEDHCRQHELKLLESPVKENAVAVELQQQLQKARDRSLAELRRLERQRDRLAFSGLQEATACVDSELALIWWGDYELRGWQVNLLHHQVPEKLRKEKPPIVMVSRLDGPTAAIAKGLVDQAVKVEKKGLSGKVYVDARGIGYNHKEDPGYGYGGYDASLREMAKLLEKDGGLEVTLDDKPELFAPGSCPKCALYCGWYSLAHYVDCCSFVPGAVAYHIASSEAVSLRDAASKQWCKCLLQDGVAATLGPVAEPYTIGFPKPAEFFGFLATGKYTLVECYYRTLLLNSWMTVLVGDPLYNPYANCPKLTPQQVKPSPEGGKPFLKAESDG